MLSGPFRRVLRRVDSTGQARSGSVHHPDEWRAQKVTGLVRTLSAELLPATCRVGAAPILGADRAIGPAGAPVIHACSSPGLCRIECDSWLIGVSPYFPLRSSRGVR